MSVCVGSFQPITDCFTTERSPVDLTMVEGMFNRKKEIYSCYQLKAAYYGGFASKQNMNIAK